MHTFAHKGMTVYKYITGRCYSKYQGFVKSLCMNSSCCKDFNRAKVYYS